MAFFHALYFRDKSEDAIAASRLKEKVHGDEGDYYFASYSHYGIHEEMLKVQNSF